MKCDEEPENFAFRITLYGFHGLQDWSHSSGWNCLLDCGVGYSSDVQNQFKQSHAILLWVNSDSSHNIPMLRDHGNFANLHIWNNMVQGVRSSLPASKRPYGKRILDNSWP